MNLKYLRITVFYGLLNPFSKWSRTRRMRSFSALTRITEGMSVLDLGGQPMIWETMPVDLNLTILNKPGIALRNTVTRHKITYIEGDACDVKALNDQLFDMVFSNSVIEHVGAADKRASFAKEVRRLGRRYWVQTPSKWFPIEAHCGMPFWWFYPESVRRYFIERWRKKLPAWTTMVEESTVLSKAELRHLFPEATVIAESFFGITKSYIAYFPGRASQGL